MQSASRADDDDAVLEDYRNAYSEPERAAFEAWVRKLTAESLPC